MKDNSKKAMARLAAAKVMQLINKARAHQQNQQKQQEEKAKEHDEAGVTKN